MLREFHVFQLRSLCNLTSGAFDSVSVLANYRDILGVSIITVDKNYDGIMGSLLHTLPKRDKGAKLGPLSKSLGLFT